MGNILCQPFGKGTKPTPKQQPPVPDAALPKSNDTPVLVRDPSKLLQETDINGPPINNLAPGPDLINQKPFASSSNTVIKEEEELGQEILLAASPKQPAVDFDAISDSQVLAKNSWKDFEYTNDNSKNPTIIVINEVPKNMPITIYDSSNLELHCFATTTQVTIENLKSCYIYLAPCESSIYVRNCSDCTIVLTSNQLRLCNCKDMDLFIWCKGQPVIEDCIGITFTRCNFVYKLLQDQMKQFNFDIEKNDYSNIFDFTPVIGEIHWVVHSDTIKRRNQYYKLPPNDLQLLHNIDTTWNSTLYMDCVNEEPKAINARVNDILPEIMVADANDPTTGIKKEEVCEILPKTFDEPVSMVQPLILDENAEFIMVQENEIQPAILDIIPEPMNAHKIEIQPVIFDVQISEIDPEIIDAHENEIQPVIFDVQISEIVLSAADIKKNEIEPHSSDINPELMNANEIEIQPVIFDEQISEIVPKLLNAHDEIQPVIFDVQMSKIAPELIDENEIQPVIFEVHISDIVPEPMDVHKNEIQPVIFDVQVNKIVPQIIDVQENEIEPVILDAQISEIQPEIMDKQEFHL